MPARNEFPQRNDTRVLREHAEDARRKHIRTRKPPGHARIRLLRCLARNDYAFATPIVHEAEGMTRATAAGPAQELVDHHGASALFVELKVIGDERRLGMLTILQLDDDRTLAVPTAQLPKTPTALPGLANTVREALRQEGKHVEDRRLAATVRAKQHRQRRQLLQRNVAQRPIVAYVQRRYAHVLRKRECEPTIALHHRLSVLVLGRPAGAAGKNSDAGTSDSQSRSAPEYVPSGLNSLPICSS